MSSPVEDAATVVVAAMVAVEAGEPVTVPHQAIKALPRMLQTGVGGASKVIQVAKRVAG